MPRSTVSPAGRLVEFFQTQPLEVAEVVLILCQETVKRRRAASTLKESKPRQQKARPLLGPLTAVQEEF